MSDTGDFGEEQFTAAIEAIARTPDGLTLYLYLQRRLMRIDGPADTDGALRHSAGERMFAAKLIGLMAQGIQDSGGRTGSAERPIIFATRGPSTGGNAPRGAGRRIGPSQSVPGYDGPSEG